MVFVNGVIVFGVLIKVFGSYRRFIDILMFGDGRYEGW